MGILAISLGTSGVVRPTDGADILAFLPMPIYSHFAGFDPLFWELADRGHRVTVVTPFHPKKNGPPGYVHVPIPNGTYKPDVPCYSAARTAQVSRAPTTEFGIFFRFSLFPRNSTQSYYYYFFFIEKLSISIAEYEVRQ